MSKAQSKQMVDALAPEDWADIAERRALRESWQSIADDYGINRGTLTAAFKARTAAAATHGPENVVLIAVQELTAQVTELTTEVGRINTKVDHVDGNVVALDQKVVKIDDTARGNHQYMIERIDATNTNLGGRIDATNTNLGGRIDALTTGLGEVREELARQDGVRQEKERVAREEERADAEKTEKRRWQIGLAVVSAIALISMTFNYVQQRMLDKPTPVVQEVAPKLPDIELDDE